MLDNYIKIIKKNENSIDYSIKLLMKKLACLGKGSYGIVYKCVDCELRDELSIEHQNIYVLKVSIGEDIHGFLREVLFFKSFTSDHIIKYYKTIILEDNYDEYSLAIKMEYKENDLRSYLKKNDLTKDKIKKIMYGICKSLYDMHTNRFIHGDLKTPNIVLNNENDIKILDFSLIQFVLNRKTNIFPNTSLCIMPPEIIHEKIDEDKSSS